MYPNEKIDTVTLIDFIGVMTMLLAIIIAIIFVATTPSPTLVSTKISNYELLELKNKDIDGLGTIRKVIVFKNVQNDKEDWEIINSKCKIVNIGSIKEIPEQFFTRTHPITHTKKEWYSNKKEDVLRAFCS
jgi:hypothetical protein